MPQTISSTIAEDLRRRIRAGSAIPFPLTLKGIAGHFSVSMMPARVAVAALLEEQFLLRDGSGRLRANVRRRSRGPQPQVPAEQPVSVAPPEDAIASHIIRLSLSGEEAFLREETVSEQFGIGRTVLRRIFSRLVGEGVLQHVPRRGWRPKPYREQDMLDYLVVRESMELLALNASRDALSPDVLESLLSANRVLPDGSVCLDNRLHQYWIDLSGNRYIQDFFRQSGRYHEYLFTRAAEREGFAAQRAAEHREILNALLAQQWDRAANALAAHIRAQRDHVAGLLCDISRGDGESPGALRPLPKTR